MGDPEQMNGIGIIGIARVRHAAAQAIAAPGTAVGIPPMPRCTKFWNRRWRAAMRQSMAKRLFARIVAAALAIIAVPGSAWATFIPLDGFMDGATTVNYDGAVDAASNVSASVPGGQRSIWLGGGTYATSATVDTANGQLIVDGTFSSLDMGYGATAWPGAPGGFGGSIQNDPTHAINQDWSGYTGIRIPFLESTAWLSVHVTGGGYYKVSHAGNLDIPFGDWTRTNVTMFTISIDNFRPGAYRIGPIQLISPTPVAVPEPASLPLFAGGSMLLFAGWMVRRRRRHDASPC
jgi:hypothetical protein